MTVHDAQLAEPLAAVNTALIVVSGVFLVIGYTLIRRRQVVWHRRAMLTAATFAGLFLVVYVVRYLTFRPRIFAGTGSVRALYLAILISHTVLAVALGPFVIITLRRALRRDFRRHRRLARITLPIWLYVVVTGWSIYYMLHAF
jgi:putative membrane protein